MYDDVEKGFRSAGDMIGETYHTSTTWNPADLASGSSLDNDVTVEGAVLGDYAEASFSLDLQGLTLTAAVTASDTVSVTLSNLTGGNVNLGEGTLKVRVKK